MTANACKLTALCLDSGIETHLRAGTAGTPVLGAPGSGAASRLQGRCVAPSCSAGGRRSRLWALFAVLLIAVNARVPALSAALTWEVTVPANTTAEITIPAAVKSITEGGRAIGSVAEIKPLRGGNTDSVFAVSSGAYMFAWPASENCYSPDLFL